MEPNLYELRLPSGDCKGFDIDYPAGTGRTKLWSRDWLSKGFTGIRIIGDRTHIRPVGDQAMLIERHNGIVEIDSSITVHCGARQGIWFGLQGKDRPTLPKFKLKGEGFEVVADMPPPGGNQHSTVWPIFGYQADLDLKEVTVYGERSAEHDVYWRGFAKDGWRLHRVHCAGSGSQGLKIRNSPSECNWVRGARVIITDSIVENWMQPWTWRGPGGLVSEGGGCDIIVQRTEFRSKPGPEYCRAVMIDDALGDFFDAATGAVGRGYANGHILLERCGFSGGPGTENLTPLIRVSNNPAVGKPQGGPWASCRSLTIKECGIWGEKTQLQLGNVPAGKLKVVDCNTRPIEEWCSARGYDTRYETVIPGQHTIAPVSGGLVR